MTDSRLKELQNELIRRQALQAQAKAMAERSLVEIKETLTEVRKLVEEHPEFYQEYSELNVIINVDADDLLNNPDNIAAYKAQLSSLVTKIEEYLETALNV